MSRHDIPVGQEQLVFNEHLSDEDELKEWLESRHNEEPVPSNVSQNEIGALTLQAALEDEERERDRHMRNVDRGLISYDEASERRKGVRRGPGFRQYQVARRELGLKNAELLPEGEERDKRIAEINQRYPAS